MYERYFEMEAFAKDVFAYFNGKINMQRYPAVLDICLHYEAYKDNGVFADQSRGHVHLYLGNILYMYNEREDNIVKIRIINTIIHELFHADQDINQKLYCTDPKYHTNIEAAADRMCMYYILNHRKDIEDIFEVVYDRRELDYYAMALCNTYVEYNRFSDLELEYLRFFGSMGRSKEYQQLFDLILDTPHVEVELQDSEDNIIYHTVIKTDTVYNPDPTLFTTHMQYCDKFNNFAIDVLSPKDESDETNITILIIYEQDPIDFGFINNRI